MKDKGLFAVVIAIVVFRLLVAAVGAAANGASHEGTRVNACHEQWNEMHATHVPPREMHFQQNMIGCKEGRARLGGNYCDMLARRVAVAWIESGRDILTLTIDAVMRGINYRLEQEGRGNIQGFDHCTVEEDLSYSWG